MESSSSRRASHSEEGQNNQDSVNASTGARPGRQVPQPPPGADPAEFYKHWAEMLQSVLNAVPAAAPTPPTPPVPPIPPTPPTRKPILERLTKSKTVEFLGKDEDDAAAADFWLERTERLLELLQATPEEGMIVAVSLLQEDAFEWWKSVSDRVAPDERTWERFSELFREQYIGRIHVEEMKKKFLGLKQLQLSVTAYEREFLRYGKYAKELIATEVDKCRRFEDGLNDYLKFQVLAFQFDSFPKLVAAVRKLERARKESNERREQSSKRGNVPQGSSQSQSKKFKGRSFHSSSKTFQSHGGSVKGTPPAYSSASVPSGGQRGPVPLCGTCGVRHPGECRRASGACF